METTFGSTLDVAQSGATVSSMTQTMSVKLDTVLAVTFGFDFDGKPAILQVRLPSGFETWDKRAVREALEAQNPGIVEEICKQLSDTLEQDQKDVVWGYQRRPRSRPNKRNSHVRSRTEELGKAPAPRGGRPDDNSRSGNTSSAKTPS